VEQSRESRLIGDGVKEGKDRYCCRDYKRIFRQWYHSIVENIYLHTNKFSLFCNTCAQFAAIVFELISNFSRIKLFGSFAKQLDSTLTLAYKQFYYFIKVACIQ